MTLDQLNDLLRRELGTTPSGRARFQWKKTTDMPLYARLSGYEEARTDSPIALMIPRWRESDWSESMGLAWTLAMWHAPMPRQQWEEMGIQSPYPANGSYMPVAGGVIPPESENPEPDEARTLFVIGRLREDLDKSYADRLREANGTIEKQKKNLSDTVDDWLSDTFTAFRNIPGHKGHTAFQVPGLRGTTEGE